MWLLDTNILSELRKGPRCDQGVEAWRRSVDPTSAYLSVIVIGEIRRGIESKRRRDSVSAEALGRWLDRLGTAYGDRILPIDLNIAEAWGRLNVPDPMPAVDGLLAATALVHDLTLVTRNISDVRRTGVRCLNPFHG
ncbi:MAG: type II toxin-antitoxin system VapC family toxin [Deltaproteobacteria bacterium]|nr:type II toxin-antitoxin system VapC family toxin [Deltaproteobacteria bacterium]